MALLKIHIGLAIIGLLGCPGGVTGMTYILALLGQNSSEGDSLATEYKLIFSGVNVGDIITITGVSGLIEAVLASVNVQSYVLDNSVALNGSQIANKTVRVEADINFTMQVFITHGQHEEGFIAIPLENLAGPRQINGTFEYIVSTFCATSGICQLAIAAEHNDTVVYIKLPGHMTDVVFCVNKAYFRGHRDTSITLHQFDAVQIERQGDLSGTRIYSFSPIVVFAGSRNVTVNNVISHSAEQLLPSSHWDTEFFVTTIGNTVYGDIIKISTSWNGTQVEISGHPKFKLNGPHFTVSKRIPRQATKRIKSTSPIQVIQITGVAFTNETSTGSTFGMTTLPGVNHGKMVHTVACCHGSSQDCDSRILFIAPSSHTKTDITQLDGSIHVPSTSFVPYSDYKFRRANVSAPQSVTITSTINVSGIITCNESAVMTFGTFLQIPDTSPSAGSDSSTSEPKCIEGRSATTVYNKNGSFHTVHTIEMAGYSILKLRVKVCGSAVVKFSDSSNATIYLLKLSGSYIQVFDCLTDTCNGSRGIKTNYTNLKKDCTKGMNFYWFVIIHDQEQNLCIGAGPFPDVTSSTCVNEDLKLPLGNRTISRISLTGDGVTASFLYDLETHDCQHYEPNWRCEDYDKRCLTFNISFCHDPQFEQFAKFGCPKYCGFCKPDSYGRKFVFWAEASKQTVVLIVITGLESLGNIAIGTKSKVLALTYANPDQRVATCMYNTVGVSEPLVIISDTDISVSVVFSMQELVLPMNMSKLQIVPLYPTDTLDTEYIIIPDYQTYNTRCYIIVDRGQQAQVKKYTTTEVKNRPIFAEEETYMSPGIMFTSDKPIAVICDNIQQIPTSMAASVYTLPSMDFTPVNRPFEIILRLMAIHDNTVVRLNGSFDDNFILQERGMIKDRAITNGPITIMASQKVIAVLCFKQEVNATLCDNLFILTEATQSVTTPVIMIPDTILSDHELLNFSALSAKTFFKNSVETTSLNTGKISVVRKNNATGKRLTMIVGSNNAWTFLMQPFLNGDQQALSQQKTCQISHSDVVDNMDNDCDGATDEDICFSGIGAYSQDYDLDGGFGEDCKSVVVVPDIVIHEPNCLPPSVHNWSCVAVCQCKCSWVRNQEAYLNMTKDEQMLMVQSKSREIISAIQTKKDTLSSTEAKSVSAKDDRQSSANLGYIGISIFVIVFGSLFIMDLGSLHRDFRTWFQNLKFGLTRLHNYVRGN